MDLKGSETERNLLAAFSGESQARNKYTYFASIARKEGYEQIAQIFLDAANNEKEHAKIWYQHLNSKQSTEDNLRSAIGGEHEEWTSMYDKFANVAEQEGFTDIANQFRLIGEIEKNHEKIFQKLLDNVKNDEVFRKKTGIHVWKCRNCGHIHTGLEAPKICPVCSHPQSYFELDNENL